MHKIESEKKRVRNIYRYKKENWILVGGVHINTSSIIICIIISTNLIKYQHQPTVSAMESKLDRWKKCLSQLQYWLRNPPCFESPPQSLFWHWIWWNSDSLRSILSLTLRKECCASLPSCWTVLLLIIRVRWIMAPYPLFSRQWSLPTSEIVIFLCVWVFRGLGFGEFSQGGLI